MFSSEVISTFIGTILAIISTGLLWILKTAYSTHRTEMAALAKYERMYAKNLMLVKDNFQHLNNWVSAVNNKRPYSFYFEPFLFNDEDSYKLKNLKLINVLISTNYMLKNISCTIEHLHKTYWETIRILDQETDTTKKEKQFLHFHENIKNTLEEMLKNQEPLHVALIRGLAAIGAVHKVRRFSLFGCIDFLFKDIYPKVSEEVIDKEELEVKMNIRKKMQENKTKSE